MSRALTSVAERPSANLPWTQLGQFWHNRRMYRQPYLETCCRSALHRLKLCDALARPAGLKDGPCLVRLAEMGMATQRPDGRFEITLLGLQRHALEIMA